MTMARMDFETFSEAGYLFDWRSEKWKSLPGVSDQKRGLKGVGARVYIEHPSFDLLCLSYQLEDNFQRLWTPACAYPLDLFEHVRAGKTIEAWNSAFEYQVWTYYCVPKLGWPPLKLEQMRCAMSRSRAASYPGALAEAGRVLGLRYQKDPDGERLLKKFAQPRNPTLKDYRLRILPQDEPIDGPRLYQYCHRDVIAECEASARLPELKADELNVWLADQAINDRGVQVDTVALDNCIAIVEQAHVRYTAELVTLTKGKITSVSEIEAIRLWLCNLGVQADSLDEEAVEALLKNKLDYIPDECRRVLEIRAAIGSASVKKVFALRAQLSLLGRVHGLFVYHSARTGRWAGMGPQPQNLPKSGPPVHICKDCHLHSSVALATCPACCSVNLKPVEWGHEAVVHALNLIRHRSLQHIEDIFGDAMATVGGCLRGLFISAPGKDLIASDYSAIEGVVLAALAGEQWRLDVFNTHGMIYEASASRICGIPFEEFVKHKELTNSHHPMRNKLGKFAELASGFQGWIGAWKRFGADEFMNDEEIKTALLAWRAASPNIVEFWGGQQRGYGYKAYSELYGIEGAAISAVEHPGTTYGYRGILYQVANDTLYCRLLSGRLLTYHRPEIRQGNRGPQLTFEGWNSNPKDGPTGWLRMSTYGGKLTENIVQATARDIMAHAMVALERAGYPIVLHVHDELVAEVPEGQGSIEEFERIMSALPDWCKDWPVKAKGGWRGKRYRK